MTWLLLFALLAQGPLPTAQAPAAAGPETLATWEGEWGAWTEEEGRLRGAGLSIGPCTDDGTQCTLRFDLETDRTRCATSGDEGVPLVPADGGATAAFTDYEGRPRDCRLTLAKQGHCDPVLQATLAGNECGYFCTRTVPLLPESFPLRTAVLFPPGQARACHADGRPSRQALCLDPALQDLARQVAGARDSLDRLTHEPAHGERLAAEEESLLAACATAGAPGECLAAGYRRILEAAALTEAAARRAGEAREADLRAPGDPARTGGLVRALAGTYTERFPNALVDGTAYESEDAIDVVPVARDAFFFRLRLEFYNGHECNASGVARSSRAGPFVWDDPAQVQEGETCRLLFEVDTGTLRILDPGGSCRAHCGARGSFHEADFPRVSRRPVADLEALRRSDEYREALARFERERR